jgi:hypothetical protein
MGLIMRNQNKISDDSKQTDTQGISGLPKPWDTAVRIVGTYGLAIFLVLYYLFVMRLADDARYEKFNTSLQEFNASLNQLSISVNRLNQIIGEKEALLTSDQTMDLKKLYIAAVINKLDKIISDKLKNNISKEELGETIRSKMLKLAVLIDDGLVQKQQVGQEVIYTKIYYDIVKRITSPEGCSKTISEDATNAWRDLPLQQVTEKLDNALTESFQLIRMPN